MLRILLSEGFNFGYLMIWLLSAIVIVFIATPIHEFSHCFAAYKLGDNTGKYQGRLTLNPLAHIDPIGALAIALIGFGWGRAAQVNPYNFKKPKLGMVITAMAGPFSNLLFAFVLIIIRNILSLVIPITLSNFTALGYIFLFFEFTIYIDISLAVFNLIPIPPLDGSKVLNAVLPEKIYFKIMKYERFLIIIVLIFIFTDVLDKPLGWLVTEVSYGLEWLGGLPFIAFL